MAARPRKAPLRAVGGSETSAPPAGPQSVSDAVSAGSARDELMAMRRVIAAAIDNPETKGADLSSLTRRLRELRRDIEAIDAREAQEGDSADVPDEAFDASAV